MATFEIEGPREEGSLSAAARIVPIPDNKEEERDSEIIKRAFEFLQVSKDHREIVSIHWERYYRLWATRMWDHINVPDWRSQPQVNFIFSTIELEVATLTNQSPELVVFPRNNSEDSIEVAEILTKIFTNSWRKAKGKIFLQNVARDRAIFGTGVGKILWDSDREDISLISVPPDQFFPDPSATGDEDLWWALHVYDVSINDIIKNWPDKAPLVTTELLRDRDTFRRDAWSSEEGQGPLAGRGRLTETQGGVSHTTIVEISKGEKIEAAEGQVTLIEFWEKDPVDGKIHLHYIVNDILLDSIDEPLGPKFKRFPFVHFPNTIVNSEYWGMSSIQPLEPLQLSINKRRQQIIDNIKILGNPPILNDRNSGLEEDIIEGAPGEIITVNDINAIKWLQPPSLPAGIFQLQQLDKSEFETISGQFDVVQGRTPTGIEAAAAIAELQEAAQVRTQPKIDTLESALEDVGQIMLLLIQSNFTEEKALMLLGEEGRREEVVVNEPRSLDEAEEELDIALEDASKVEVITRALDLTRGDFDVEILAGSTLPINKNARLNEALLLLQAGAIDPEELLTTINHPRRKEIMARFEEIQQAAIEAQQGATQLGMGEAGPLEGGGGDIGSSGQGIL